MRVSVIIPTYNREGYISESIESVLSQDGDFDLEVIVVDDGSTDGTEEVLRRFGNKIIYRRIRASGRPAVPRNIGIRMAQGDLVAFQDSDDLWVKDKLKTQVPVFDDPNVVMSYGNAEIMREDGTRTGETIINPERVYSGYIYKELLETNFISTLTVMIRREVLDRIGLFNESWKLFAVEDYELWLRVAGSKTGKLVYIDKILAYYRQHPANVSITTDLDALKRIIRAQRSLLKQNMTSEHRRFTEINVKNLYLNAIRIAEGKNKERLNREYQLFRIQRKLLRGLGF